MAYVHEAVPGACFGRLTVINVTRGLSPNGSKVNYALCSCSCGSEPRNYLVPALGRGSNSCGCLRKEVVSNLKGTHRSKNTREYNSWRGMWERCTNPNHKNYELYKDRAPPERWRDFSVFIADMGSAPEGYTLDRIKNELPYGPDNCKWSPPSEQVRNSSRAIWLSHPVHGKMVIKDAAAVVGVNYSAATDYLRRNKRLHPSFVGWSLVDKEAA